MPLAATQVRAIKNPHSTEAPEQRSPAELAAEIIEKEQRILAIMQDIKQQLEAA